MSHPFVVCSNVYVLLKYVFLQEHTPSANRIAKTSKTGSTRTHAQREWTHSCHSCSTSRWWSNAHRCLPTTQLTWSMSAPASSMLRTSRLSPTTAGSTHPTKIMSWTPRLGCMFTTISRVISSVPTLLKPWWPWPMWRFSLELLDRSASIADLLTRRLEINLFLKNLSYWCKNVMWALFCKSLPWGAPQKFRI